MPPADRRSRIARAGAWIRGRGRAIARLRAEILVTVALVAGWSLLTAGLADLMGDRVWLFSGGLFFLSAAGWRLLYRVAADGLYSLTREASDG